MYISREYYKYVDKNGIYLLLIGAGFVFPHYLSAVRPTRYTKKYRGLYRCNLSVSVDEFNRTLKEHAVKLTQEEFNKEADEFKIKMEMLQELVH